MFNYSSHFTVFVFIQFILFFLHIWNCISFCLCFWGGTGEKQIRSVSAETCLVTKACSGGRLHGNMHEETKTRGKKKKRKDKGTFFQVCFSLSPPPEAQSFYELSGLFLKSGGLSALQKQHRLPKKLKGRVVFFPCTSFPFLFKNSENYSKPPLFSAPSLFIHWYPPSWSFPADKHGSESHVLGTGE